MPVFPVTMQLIDTIINNGWIINQGIATAANLATVASFLLGRGVNINQVNDLDREQLIQSAQVKRNRIQNDLQARNLINIAEVAKIEARLKGDFLTNNQLNPNRNRYLYLAGKRYAGAQATLDFALKDNFICRSLYDTSKRFIHNVDSINTGDIIVLAYRENGRFGVLSPFVVRPDLTNYLNVQLPQGVQAVANSPFKQLNNRQNKDLIERLIQERYNMDPQIGYFTGIPVVLLDSNLNNPLSVTVFNQTWPSPGRNTIWRQDQRNRETQVCYLPQPVRDWMNSL